MTPMEVLVETLKSIRDDKDTRSIEFLQNNLTHFYRIHLSFRLAKQNEIPFDMREDFWWKPQRPLFVYLANLLWQKAKPAELPKLTEFCLELSQCLERTWLSVCGQSPRRQIWNPSQDPKANEEWWKYIRDLKTALASAPAVTIPPELRTHRQLKDHVSGTAWMRQRLESLPSTYTTEDIIIQFNQRLVLSSFLDVSDREALLKKSLFFLSWYSTFASTNAYLGAAQAFAPIAGNSDCNDLLRCMEQWTQGIDLGKAPYLGLDRFGEKKQDYSRQKVIQELAGFCDLPRRPYLNSANTNALTRLLELPSSIQSQDIAAALGQKVREILRSEKSLCATLTAFWRESKKQLPELQCVHGERWMKSFGSIEENPLLHHAKVSYAKAWNSLDLGFNKEDEACAMAHILLDIWAYRLSEVKTPEPRPSFDSQASSIDPALTMLEDGRPVWLIGTGGGDLWSRFQEGSYVAISFHEHKLGNLDQFASLDSIVSHIQKVTGTDSSYKNDSLAAWEFGHEMDEGDWVVARRGTTEILGIGQITGPYQYQEGQEHFAHRRAVRWLWTGSRELSEKRMSGKTLTEISGKDELLSEIADVCAGAPHVTSDELGGGAGPVLSLVETPTFDKEKALESLFLPTESFEDMLNGLRSKKNIVLQGPPGVGKTFVAKKLAASLLGTYDPQRMELIQFHPSFSYEDFVQGMRPDKDGKFRLKDGIFFRLCSKAKRDPQRDYCLIIDEINRAHLGKVFGELMMLLEADKRDPSYAVRLTYADEEQEKFFIPENVYLIGTMNTADKSLSLMDLALRRRFAFYDLLPGFALPKFESFLREAGMEHALIRHLIREMAKLNDEIEKDRKNLGPGFEIGHSYFCPKVGETPDRQWYERIIKHEIRGILLEYFGEDMAEYERSLLAG